MAVNKWIIIDATSANYKNRYLLKINGLRDDILNVFNQFINDCEVPFAIHNDKDFNWGLFYYDPSGKVSDKILKELATKLQEDQVKSGFLNKKMFLGKIDVPEKQQEDGSNEEPNKIEISNDYFSDFMKNMETKSANKDQISARQPQEIEQEQPKADIKENEILLPPELPKTTSEPEPLKQQESIEEPVHPEPFEEIDIPLKPLKQQERVEEPVNAEPYKEIDIPLKLPKQQENIEEPVRPEMFNEIDIAPLEPQQNNDSADDEVKGLMNELNSVLSDLTQSEKKRLENRIKTDWHDKIDEIKQKIIGNETQKIKNKPVMFEKSQENVKKEAPTKYNDAVASSEKVKQKSLDDRTGFNAGHADEIPISLKNEKKIQEPILKGSKESIEIEDRTRENAKLGQNAEKIPEELLKSDVQLSEIPKDYDMITDEKAEKPNVDNVHVELTDNEKKIVQTPAEVAKEKHIIEEIKKAPAAAEIGEIQQHKPSDEPESTVKNEPIRFTLEDSGASHPAPAPPQEQPKMDIPIKIKDTVKQAVPEPQKQEAPVEQLKEHKEETANKIQEPAAPEPPGVIDVCCIFPKDETDLVNQFFSGLGEVVEKTTKSKFKSQISLKYPIEPENTDVEKIMTKMSETNFDLIVLIDVPAMPRMIVNNISVKMKENKKNFKVISKSNIGKKFIYVDLVIDSVLKKKQI